MMYNTVPQIFKNQYACVYVVRSKISVISLLDHSDHSFSS